MSTTVEILPSESLLGYLKRVLDKYDARLVYYAHGEIVIYERPKDTLVGPWGGADRIFEAPKFDSLPPQGHSVWAKNAREAASGGSDTIEGRRPWGITANGEILQPDDSPASGHPTHNGIPLWLAIKLADGFAVASP